MTDSNINYIRPSPLETITREHRMFQHTMNKKLTKCAQKNGSTFRREKKKVCNLKIRKKKEMKKRGHVENRKLFFTQ